MSNLNLGGFDVVVHLAENVINHGLRLLPGGNTFPVRERSNITLTSLAVPIPLGQTKNIDMLYDAFVEIERPQIALNQSTGRVTVTCSLSPASQLAFSRTQPPADATHLAGIVPQIPLAGTVQLDCPFAVADVFATFGNELVAGRAAVAQAGGINATIALVVPSVDSSGDVVLASSVIGASSVTIAASAIRAALESAFGSRIGGAIGDLPLTNPVRLNQGSLPVYMARDVRARISPTGSPRAVTLGVLTGIEPASPGGNLPAPPTGLGTAGALVLVANYWTLHLVCSALQLAHPGMRFDLTRNPPRARFQGAVTVPGGEQPVTIRRFDIDATNGLAVDGDAIASGPCWTADIAFDFRFEFTCDPQTGAVLPGATPPNVTVDVDKDLLCIIVGVIAGIVSGAIIGGVIGGVIGFFAGGPGGALIGAGIGAVAGGLVGGFVGWGVADALIDPLSLDGVSLDSVSVLGGLTLPLPVGGAGLLVEACQFDDLAVRARIIYLDLAERHRSGATSLSPGMEFDLDTGVARAQTPDATGADLVWTGGSLQTASGAVLGPVLGASAFQTLSLYDLKGFTYAGSSIAAAQIPVVPMVAFRLGPTIRDFGEIADRAPSGAPGDWVSFAVRTSDGRFAKCRARRDRIGTLTLEYVVYAQPKACLGSLLTLETISSTVVDSGTETCTEVRSEVMPPPRPFRPSVVSLLPPVALRAGVAASSDGSATGFATGPRLADLFDSSLVASPLVVKPPKTVCGSHSTIELHDVEWQIVERAQHATLQVLPTGAAAPLRYRWRVFGTELPGGSGTLTIGDVDVSYDEDSPMLTLDADEGIDLSGSITIHAIDAHGRKLGLTRSISSPTRKRLGGCCPSQPQKLTVADAGRLLDHARTALRIYEAGLVSSRVIAATGEAEEVKSVSVAEAVAHSATTPRRKGRSRSGRGRKRGSSA